MNVTKGDILAAIDLLAELCNAADQLEVDEATAFSELLGQLGSEVKRTASMIDTALKAHLEDGARQVGDRVYAKKRDGKTRFDHDHIGTRVAALAAIDTETGQIRESAHDAAREAVRLMMKLYVSPADKPHTVHLAALGLAKREVSRWEHTGTKIVVTDLSAPEED
jgi:hypothetical protein